MMKNLLLIKIKEKYHLDGLTIRRFDLLNTINSNGITASSFDEKLASISSRKSEYEDNENNELLVCVLKVLEKKYTCSSCIYPKHPNDF